MRIYSGNGVIIENPNKGLKLFLDPNRVVRSRKDEFVGISHAHSDHTRPHKVQLLSTTPTKALSRYESEMLEHLEYNKAIELDGFSIEALNANHILGSCQFKLTHRSSQTTLVYSGDIRLNKSPLFDKPYISKAGTLIVESTYGLSNFRFPQYNEIKQQVQGWLGENSSDNVIFGVYSLGKAQEAVYMLNQLGYTPLVHPDIERFCKIYEQHGIKLGKYISTQSYEAQQAMKEGFAAVLPTRLMKREFFHSIKDQTKREVKSALLTGWAQQFYFPHVDRVFALSDHADYYQLLEYVRQVEPDRVYTVHGYTQELAKAIKDNLGIQASPLENKQLTLSDF